MPDLQEADPHFNIYGRGDVCDTMITQRSGQCEEPEEQLDEGNLSKTSPLCQLPRALRLCRLHRAITRFKSGLSRKGAADISSRDVVANV
jgi:hypothetical protein